MTSAGKYSLGSILAVEVVPISAIGEPIIPTNGLVDEIYSGKAASTFKPIGYGSELIAEPISNGYQCRLTVQVLDNATNRSTCVAWKRIRHLLVVTHPGATKRILGNLGNGAKCEITFSGGNQAAPPSIALTFTWLTSELPYMLTGSISPIELNLDSLTVPDITTDEDLKASAIITALGKGGTTEIKFKWILNDDISVENSKNYTFAPYETKTINVSEALPIGAISGSYTCEISGGVSGSDSFYIEVPVIITLNITTFASQTQTLKYRNTAPFYVDWGDGVVETCATSVSSEVTKTHLYSANGDFIVKMYGGVRFITSYYLNMLFKTDSNIDLTGLMGISNATNAYRIELTSSRVVNKIKAPITPNHIYFATQNTVGDAVIKSKELDLSGCRIITTRPSDTSIYTLIINRQNTTITKLDVTNIIPLLVDNVQKGIHVYYGTAFNQIIGNVGWCRNIYLNYCAFNQTSIDRFLSELVAGGNVNGTFNSAAGTSAAPSAAGIANKNILVARGWVVTTN